MASIVAINYLRWNDVEPAWGYNAGNAAYLFLQAFNAWFWVLAILGWGRRMLGFRNRFLDYASEGIYPFYLLHQTVIVVVAFYVIRAPDGVWAKFWFTSAVSMALSPASSQGRSAGVRSCKRGGGRAATSARPRQGCCSRRACLP